MAKLIALSLIAAGAYATNQPGFTEGEKFEAPDDIADRMRADRVAKDDTEVATETKKTGKVTKVRLLVDSALGDANDVVELDAAALKDAEAAGLADSNKAAVAYALTLEQNKP